MSALAERTQVLELVQTLPDEQIRYVLHVIQNLPHQELVAPRCKLRGRFSSYANPILRKKEKEAWSLAAEEKHGIR